MILADAVHGFSWGIGDSSKAWLDRIHDLDLREMVGHYDDSVFQNAACFRERRLVLGSPGWYEICYIRLH